MTINPWDVQPFPANGTANIEDLYSSIGRALSAWEHFEGGLAGLFGFMTGARKYLNTPAMRAYGSVITFKGRVEMIQAASAAYFSKRKEPILQKRCKELIRDGLRYSPRRNEIAHGVVMPYCFALKGKSSTEHVLTAGWHSTGKRIWSGDKRAGLKHIGMTKYIYSAAEIGAFDEKFMLIGTQALKLGNDVRDGVVRPESDYIRQ